MKNEIWDWHGFPVFSWEDETCAVCHGEGADTEENGVMYHKDCLMPFHETPEYQEAWRKYLNNE